MDKRLRELERRWRRLRTAESEAALLTERLRVGDLSRERLMIAAECGHEASRVILGLPKETAPADLEEWLCRLQELGREPWLRVQIAVARDIGLQQWNSVHDDPTPTRLLDAIEQALASPGRRSDAQVQRAARRLGSLLEETADAVEGEAEEAALNGGRMAMNVYLATLPASALGVPRNGWEYPNPDFVAFCESPGRWEEGVRQAIRNAVPGWALG